ncbi:RNA 2',3'-cyclic phosphodiesterase [Lactonifactor longoviformis]|uniref:RNA 2',3'-cyclic phosphodiesterase n=1 Tax=Lactonifactor longoviformis DSM 17459 TaxID=1122155 RepID=A0A1M4YX99_9CLOT|nr:RNA 2',3'-cyclic phosphodiesterase [Lactonifactor longoviformis]POP33307.1 RNA 2',3'-cyclic phosphodiesterase [Lactonifactor longoviformis]SHF10444.1 2'-5' RNA ligase [Lactonifactor longoviformis DSM 17459]
MRLFVAIQLSDEMKTSLIGLMHDCKTQGIKGNYTPAQNLHLTLCFIGETKEKDTIKQALKAVKYKPFKLALTETGNFDDLIWAGARSGQSINSLVTDISKALHEAGIPFDEKKFVPHITLIRKASKNPGKLAIKKVDMMVKKISLMKSERVNGKMVYTEIFSF